MKTPPVDIAAEDSTVAHDAKGDADVLESFQALEAADGTISLQDLQTIYLGLGFLPTRFATLPNLSKQFTKNSIAGPDQRITLDQALDFLSKHHRQDPIKELKATFDQWDVEKRGYIDISNVVAVSSQQQQRHPPLTDKQAQRLIHYSTLGEDRVVFEDFQRLFLSTNL